MINCLEIIISNFVNVNFYYMRIFFNDIKINIQSDCSEALLPLNIVEINKLSELTDFIDKLHGGNYRADIILCGIDENILINDFIKQYIYIEAAGGIVTNPDDEYLIIKRLGIWDLPKGKIEKGELIEDGAIREVCEETGLSSVKILEALPDTFHIYFRKKKWYLKRTYWFSMTTESRSKLVPQQEEDISEALWMSKMDTVDAISKSYRSIADVLGKVI